MLLSSLMRILEVPASRVDVALPLGLAAVIAVRVAELVRDLVEPARVQAFVQLGDGRRALALAVRWLRPKVATVDPVPPRVTSRPPTP